MHEKNVFRTYDALGVEQRSWSAAIFTTFRLWVVYTDLCDVRAEHSFH